MSDEPTPLKTPPRPSLELLTHDGVDFHVQREILKFASDCFDGMFSVAGGHGDSTALQRDGKPIVVLPEPESVLYRLLCLAYPAQTPEHYTLGVANLDGLVAVHQAAHKYQFISAQRLIERMLDNPTLIDARPHRLFAIARLWNLHDVARKAAISTLKYTVYPPPPAFPEMKILRWEDVHKLQEFHEKCGIAARDIAVDNARPQELPSIGSLESSQESKPRPSAHYCDDVTKQHLVWWVCKNHSPRCRTSEIRVSEPPVSWFRSHIARLAMQLYLRPSRDRVIAEVPTLAPAERGIIDTCAVCFKLADRDLASFTRQLAADIEASNTWLAEQTF
ncbi:hypothetical protein B0H13DRAFT_2332765 [Mycena leptocephala]|nr:hypothetical protein B0H13DRAFT_2332765 [Mycena leptocephala]